MNLEKQFTEIYEAHASKVFRLCLGYASGNEDLAKEWQQETFIKVWQHRKSFKGKSSISTWIYRIAVNICLADLRKTKLHTQISDKLVVSATTEPEYTKKEEQLEQMYHCISQLTQNNKTIILMELEEISQLEIAETVGLTHGTLRTRLNRIRQSLLKCITNGK
ncbi:sigma-70 family RNA polymerase sigma factor [Flavobacterium sediminilitoris]|uniref:Sigma-70 family RNA polymerase sigma factor n=1 Tax=Flavobacterium sediminilitoris TaxID=2024526 RepID=A0ABY4HJJ5_9FLAO|nr:MULTISPECIES: sigma-70 family RNA polymerase sigma factor [Flavobacterium]UOX33012.1 sigma-70 family RNA polymerase sigma factor [Flavobacterium sediminilitoris]